MKNPPDNEKIAEILNNGIIGIQDRMDSLNNTLGEIAKSLNYIAKYFENKWEGSK